MRRHFGVSVIGYWPSGTRTWARRIEPIATDRMMCAGDVLLVAGDDDSVERFLAFVREAPPRSPALAP